MALWTVHKNRRNAYTVQYKNNKTGQVHYCGEVRLDTPKEMIVKWVVGQEATNPGDTIRFDDGTVFAISNTIAVS
jgi:hypothetical protein